MITAKYIFNLGLLLNSQSCASSWKSENKGHDFSSSHQRLNLSPPVLESGLTLRLLLTKKLWRILCWATVTPGLTGPSGAHFNSLGVLVSCRKRSLACGWMRGCVGKCQVLTMRAGTDFQLGERGQFVLPTLVHLLKWLQLPGMAKYGVAKSSPRLVFILFYFPLLLLCYKSRIEWCDRDFMTHRVWNSYSLVLYGPSLPTRILSSCVFHFVFHTTTGANVLCCSPGPSRSFCLCLLALTILSLIDLPKLKQ